jgi:hypothetical protein
VSEIERVLAWIGGHDGETWPVEVPPQCLVETEKVLRALAADFAGVVKRSEAQDKLLSGYRLGKPPAESTFTTLDRYSREWLAEARDRWRLPR